MKAIIKFVSAMIFFVAFLLLIAEGELCLKFFIVKSFAVCLLIVSAKVIDGFVETDENELA